MHKNRNELFSASAVVDIFVNVLALCLSYLCTFYRENASIASVAIVLSLGFVIFAEIIYFVFGVYDVSRFSTITTIIKRVLSSQALVFFGAGLLLIIAKKERLYLFFLLGAIVFSTVLMIIKQAVTIKFLHQMQKRSKYKKKILLVGNSDSLERYKEQMYDNLHFGYTLAGVVTEREDFHMKRLGGFDDFEKILKEIQPFEVVIAFSNTPEDTLQRTMNTCDRYGIRASIIPECYQFFRSACQIDMMGTVPVVNPRTIPLDNFGNAFLKRLTDIVIAFVMIVLTSPLMLFAVIGVKLSSKGPAIFKQKRVGKENKEFTIYKFRSMKVNDQESEAWTTNEDPRKTRFGTFIRKTGIDELPQLFNVLIGNMSMVGPRPELRKFVEEYSERIPLYKVKHEVKPGITGLAQIYGYRGDTSIEKRIEMDIKYIENWTFLGDIKIILKTPFKMFNRNEKYIR